MLPRDVQEIARAEGAPARTAEEAAAWLLSPAAGRLPAVRRYLFFLKWMDETFHAVAELFPAENPGRAGRNDARGMATSPEEMLHLANHLYLLVSHEVPGALLECGCFKGFSSCCLSHACSALGRELWVADSFAGLPAAGPGEEGYAAGDFRGGRAEVEDNVRAFGRPEAVRYLEGWFAESLQGWSRPLALLWLDVDLYRSTMDVLGNIFPTLDPRGAIFSHEILPDHLRDGRIVHPGEPPGALRDFLEGQGVPYQAAWLCGWTGRVDLPASAGRGAERLLAMLLPRLQERDHRARAARQAIGLKPALADLVRRTRTRLGGGT